MKMSQQLKMRFRMHYNSQNYVQVKFLTRIQQSHIYLYIMIESVVQSGPWNFEIALSTLVSTFKFDS